MKNTHPAYHTDTKVKCACGHTFTTSSTMESISVEICSNCHPVYTGVKKIVDAAGRVEKFQARMKKAQAGQKAKIKTKKAKIQLKS